MPCLGGPNKIGKVALYFLQFVSHQVGSKGWSTFQMIPENQEKKQLAACFGCWTFWLWCAHLKRSEKGGDSGRIIVARQKPSKNTKKNCQCLSSLRIMIKYATAMLC